MAPDNEDMETFASAAVPESTGSSAGESAGESVPVISGAGESSAASDLPKSVLDYYINIEKVLEREEFDNDSERGMLEEKLLEQIVCDGLVRILYHWDCSRVVERMLVECTTTTLLAVGRLILPHVVELATHNFASHVLELFIMKLVRDIHTSSNTSELVEIAEQVFRKLCLNVTELVNNSHGSYTLRLSLQVLVGVRVEDVKRTKKRWEIGKSSFYETPNTHPALKRVLHKFTKRLVKEDVGKLLWSQQGAPLLSVLMLLLAKTNNKSLQNLKTVVSTSFEEKVTDYKGAEQFGPLPAVLLDSKSSYVIQALIKVSSKEELEALYKTHYKDIIVPLSLHPIANYTVQTLLDHVPSRDTAHDICSRIVPVFEDLLAESITGLVISVIRCCHHHGLTSFNIMRVLQGAFHVPDDQLHLFFRCLMSLTTHDVLLEKLESYKQPTQSGKPRRDRFEATLAGSLLLQGLFRLGEVALLEEGLCGLSEDHIVYLSTNPQSSHALQTFLESLTVPPTVKHRFIKTGVFVVEKLVTTPSGSRIVEAMWQASDNLLKSSIARVLMEKKQAIKDNTYGSMVWKNCNLKEFKLGVKTWEESERKKKRKIETFEKIINNVESGKIDKLPIKNDLENDTIVSKKLKEKENVNISSSKPKKSKKSKKLKQGDNG